MLPFAAIVERLLRHGVPAVVTDITLTAASERVVAFPVRAQRELPAGDESVRDGFAVAQPPLLGGDSERVFTLAGEIAAGGSTLRPLAVGESCSVMTGAAVPPGTLRVVPQELCRVVDKEVHIPVTALGSPHHFLHKRGSLLRPGELLVSSGEVLCPGLLERLAAAGVQSLQVFRRPQAAYFCTGRELVALGGELLPGQKFSSNQLALAALIARYGGIPRDLGLVADDPQCLVELFGQIRSTPPPLLISTGGTGPGRYDLVAEAFTRAGGEVAFHSLPMRPGNSVVFGWLDKMLFCGLPGPPQAVQTLFAAIVGPLLMKLQGVGGRWPGVVEAELAKELSARPWPVFCLYPANMTIREGHCLVWPVGRNEPATDWLLLPPNTAGLPAGSIVRVLLPDSPFAGRPAARRE